MTERCRIQRRRGEADSSHSKVVHDRNSETHEESRAGLPPTPVVAVIAGEEGEPQRHEGDDDGNDDGDRHERGVVHAHGR